MKRVSKAKAALSMMLAHIQNSNLTSQSTVPVDLEQAYKEVFAQLDRLEDIVLVSSRRIKKFKEKYKEE